MAYLSGMCKSGLNYPNSVFMFASMKYLKQSTYLEKLKALQRQYIALEYRLNKLIELETGIPESPVNELLTIQQSADFAGCTNRHFNRLVKEYDIQRIVLQRKVYYKKVDLQLLLK